MGDYRLLLPKMGESVIEATILTWHKKEGDSIQENEILLEVATDKVDSDVPSPVSGIIQKILHQEGDVVAIGAPLALITVDGDVETLAPPPLQREEPKVEYDADTVMAATTIDIAPEPGEAPAKKIEQEIKSAKSLTIHHPDDNQSSGKYFSPLVLNIARVEGISMVELDSIKGSGLENRVTKEDILAYVSSRADAKKTPPTETPQQKHSIATEKIEEVPKVTPPPFDITSSSNTEIITMDRMRKLIARNMVESKHISAHVSSFVEADVTNIVLWRNQRKDEFKRREGFNLTFMPIFVEAIARAIKDFSMINVSVDGDSIIKKKNINIGIATALPSGNLIVPVIKNADMLSLKGLASAINDLAAKARNNKLNTTDIEGGTYTISNIGTFGNIIGTPIIPQPQVAIMAVGAITKKPVVLETPQGDVIAIRHMMYLSHTYDHRVVDGALGGMFVKQVAEYLEDFDIERNI